MGASGAGKTSLLNILADRIPIPDKACISGNILFNDEIPVNKHTFSKYAAYVQQEDILFARFTVREALTFAARLKLTIPHEEQDARVEDLIHDLGLQYVAHKQIGNVFHRILNFGERKRTSIGLELISDPSVIMLDEPTSGMDSFRAREIVALMHDLARNKGKTVCSTIHQPSSEAFFYFDRLIIMCDGNIVYQGDAAKSPAYFRSIKYDMPRFANPADIFMKLLAINYPKTSVDLEKIDYLRRCYRINQ